MNGISHADPQLTESSHSDVHSIYGETPMETDIAGHEGVGYVVKRKPIHVPVQVLQRLRGPKLAPTCQKT